MTQIADLARGHREAELARQCGANLVALAVLDEALQSDEDNDVVAEDAPWGRVLDERGRAQVT